MRILAFLLPFLLLTSFASAQVDKQTGKTEAQILKMGAEGWMSYYTEKVGSSTADMCQGARIYGDAAKHRNDRLLANQLDGDFKLQVEKLRKLLTAYANAGVDYDYALSGGGTMYNIMWASVEGEVEDTLYAILTSTGMKPKPMVVSRVSKELAKLDTKLAKAAKDEYVHAADGKKALATMKNTYRAIVDVAKHMSRKDSDRLLEFCYVRAQRE